MVANWERRNTPNYSNRSRNADTVLPGTVLDVGFQTIYMPGAGHTLYADYAQACSCSTSLRSMYSASVVERY